MNDRIGDLVGKIATKFIYFNSRILVSGVLWVFVEKFLRLGMGLLVGVWVARYMGPNKFGAYCLVLSLFAVVQVISKFGLDDILSRKLVEHPGLVTEVLGTFFYIKLAASIGAIFLVYLYFLIFDPSVEVYFLFLTSLSLLFSPFDVLEAFFQVNSRLLLVAIGRIVQLIFSSALKVWFVLAGFDFQWFFILFSIDAATLIFVLLWLFFHAKNPSFFVRWNRVDVKVILISATPILVSNIFVILYMKLDQIVVGRFLGNEGLGLYGASLRLLEVWYMLPVVSMSALFPFFLKVRRDSIENYIAALQKSLSIAALAAIFIAIVVSFYAVDLMVLIYGVAYIKAGYILRVQIWSVVFVFLGVIGNAWVVAEGLQKYMMYKTFIGLALGLVLSIFCVNKFGLVGAAFSSLFSQFMVSFILDLCFRETRPLFFLKLNSLRFFRLRRSFL
jgi:O-antigen/teichoic acid export membrane protein